MSMEKVIEAALADLGYTEEPGNMTKFGQAFGMNGVPWCVEALWYWFREGGESKAFFNGGKTASCTALMQLYQAEGRWFTDGNYQKGDIPIMTFNKKREVQHCGLIIDKSAGGGWYTVEGNTSPGLEGSQDRGGCVAQKIRHAANILGVCRPNYSKEPEITDIKPDYVDHWAEKSIRKAINNGVMQGYPDGSFRPNNGVTRAELAEMLDRLGLLDK